MASHPGTVASSATATTASTPAAAWWPRVPRWVAPATIVVVAVIAYWPALSGSMLWDDEAHITRADLRSLDGLCRIWFEVVGPRYDAVNPEDPTWSQGATQQYYPLLHSFFWLEWHLWGDNTVGYHVVNLVLHLTAAWLVYAIMRRLLIPGALLAAAIFVLHPVEAESVAWITEQKNTLSAVFYLSAMLAYLHFDEQRGKGWYAFALVLFVLGLASKTVSSTLPAALLVIFWWQRGRVSWRRDVLPLTPFFVLGIAAGLATAWLEHNVIAAVGQDFNLTFVERGLLAGRAAWFYLGKVVWPTNLIFFYPRWEIDAGDWRQWLYPISVIAAMAVLCAIRKRTRAPLAAALLFVGTLFPALGFFNVYPFKFSYVADHFQYLASLAIIVLFAAATTSALARCPRPAQVVGGACCVLLVGILALLTREQTPKYANPIIFYQTILDRNPDCWVAYNNLGAEYLNKDQMNEAMDHLNRELTLKPNFFGGHAQMGAALLKIGRDQEAIKHLERAVELRPRLPESQNNLGHALFKVGRVPEAFDHFHEALRLKPNYAEAECNLGKALLDTGKPLEAIQHLERSLQLKPEDAEAHCNLGVALRTVGRVREAIDQYREAIRLKPKYAAAYSNLGIALLKSGQGPQGIEQLEQAVRIDPDFAEGHNNLATVLLQIGRLEQALGHLEEALRINPDSAQVWASAASAQVQLGRTDEGIASAEKALVLARAQGQTSLAGQLESWLRLLRGAPAATP